MPPPPPRSSSASGHHHMQQQPSHRLGHAPPPPPPHMMDMPGSGQPMGVIQKLAHSNEQAWIAIGECTSSFTGNEDIRFTHHFL